MPRALLCNVSSVPSGRTPSGSASECYLVSSSLADEAFMLQVTFICSESPLKRREIGEVGDQL